MTTVGPATLRALQMGPVVKMRLYAVRNVRRVRTGWCSFQDIEEEIFPFYQLEDEHESDMPLMRRLAALGLYEMTEKGDGMDEYVQWAWRRTPEGDALLAALLTAKIEEAAHDA
jgi:hypothetical protein